MKNSRRLVVGSSLLVLAALQWVVAEAVTAAAWSSPPYSYLSDYISDLGVPDCGTQFQGRTICSPLHPLMNASFIAEGILFAAGILLLSRLITRDRTRAAVRILAVLHGIGLTLVGLFHGSPSGPDAGLIIHVSAAAVAIISANTIAILAGASRALAAPAPYRIFSLAIGALGLLSEAVVGVSAATAGLFERGGVYSWLLWGLVTGIVVLVKRSPRLVA